MVENNQVQQKSRPPIVVIMGHVDHGKTTLLDYIRKTNIADREAGGITQSIGAYEITHNGKKITFIDTPGHEAFSKMRARGANVADLAILIVSADDGIQPQTKESIEILTQTKTPFIVAINKIDKANADVEKTKNDLMQAGVFLEGCGGNVSWHLISAKQGTGVDELLDLIFLVAEMENLNYDESVNASGIIIEAKMDGRRGITAVAIVKNGILKNGDAIATSTVCGKIKSLENFLGEKTDKLEPSAPALILGFDNLPQTGEEFIAGEISLEQIKKVETMVRPKLEIEKARRDKPALNMIIKADVCGSLEALSEIIRSLNQENVKINILEEAVGEISDGDVKRASHNNSLVIGFNIKSSKAADNLAKALEVKIITSKIIYELVQTIEKEMKDIENPPPLGELEVIALFSQNGKKQLVGGKVISGVMKNRIDVKITRINEKLEVVESKNTEPIPEKSEVVELESKELRLVELGTGKITSLKSRKQEVNQVLSPNECGIIIESSITIAIGDHIIHESPKRTV